LKQILQIELVRLTSSKNIIGDKAVAQLLSKATGKILGVKTMLMQKNSGFYSQGVHFNKNQLR